MPLRVSVFRFLAAVLLMAAFFSGCDLLGLSAKTGNPPTPKDSVTVLVLDSLDGTSVDGADIAVTDRNRLTSHVISGSSVTLDLDPTLAPFTITASLAGHAISSYQDFDPSAHDSLELICHELGMITRPASPVTITSIMKTANSDGTAAHPIASGIDPSQARYLVVSATASSGIEATALQGFGIKIDFDTMPTEFNGLVPSSFAALSTPVAAGFMTTAVFDLQGWALPPGPHSLRVVAYDVANNRTETSVPFTVAGASGTGVDITAAHFGFSEFVAKLRAYGRAQDYFSRQAATPRAMPNSGATPTSYRSWVSFRFQDLSNTVYPADQPILGFDVDRSANGGAWVRVGTVNYGSPGTGSSGVHTFDDMDSTLVPGLAYGYRVTVFTDGIHRRQSGVTSAILMQAFTASLMAPADFSEQAFDNVGKVAPQFSFTISNATLWDPSESDYFYFALLIRDLLGTDRYFAAYRYSFAQNVFQYKISSLAGGADTWMNFETKYGGNNSDYMAYAGGTVTLGASIPYLGEPNLQDGTAFAAVRGQAYEWDIFGELIPGSALGSSTGMVPCWFEKEGTNGGVAKSFADSYDYGQDALNGWFAFTVR